MSSWSLRCVDVDLQLKLSGPVIAANSLDSLKKSFTPLTNIGKGKSILFDVCVVELMDS